MAVASTAEQQASCDVFAAGRDLALVAGTGTGKTSTLILMGAATRKRGLYMAFNRAIANDAQGHFGPNVECRTAHSLAFRAVGHSYRERLDARMRIPAKQTARILGITRDLPTDSHRIKVSHQARLVMGMIRRFCCSTDRQVMARHLELVNGLDVPGQEYLARMLLPYAMLAEATASTRLTDLTAAVPAYAIDDISKQMQLTERPLAPFRALPQPAKVCGPVFAGSSDIGGADADYILDGLLLDCKATNDPRRLGREEIYQLADYLLLGYDDHFTIDRLGLYLSRQGGLITWSTEEFLRRLGTTTPLPQLRAKLRKHLQSAAKKSIS